MLHTPSPVWGEIYWEDDLAVVIQKDLNSKEQHAPSYHPIVSQICNQAMELRDIFVIFFLENFMKCTILSDD